MNEDENESDGQAQYPVEHTLIRLAEEAYAWKILP